MYGTHGAYDEVKSVTQLHIGMDTMCGGSRQLDVGDSRLAKRWSGPGLGVYSERVGRSALHPAKKPGIYLIMYISDFLACGPLVLRDCISLLSLTVLLYGAHINKFPGGCVRHTLVVGKHTCTYTRSV